MNRREPKIRGDKRLSMKMHVNGNGNENENEDMVRGMCLLFHPQCP